MESDFVPTSVLGSLLTPPYTPGTIGDTVLGSYYAADYNRMMRISPESLYLVPGNSPAPYISPQEKTRQELTRKVSDLREELQIRDLLEQKAELLVQLAQKDVRREQLKRELYELQLLLHTCEVCHIAFNKRTEEGSIEVKAQKNATVCSAKLGDSVCCAKLQKAQEVAKSRAEKAGQTALNDYESTGD